MRKLPKMLIADSFLVRRLRAGRSTSRSSTQPKHRQFLGGATPRRSQYFKVFYTTKTQTVSWWGDSAQVAVLQGLLHNQNTDSSLVGRLRAGRSTSRSSTQPKHRQFLGGATPRRSQYFKVFYTTKTQTVTGHSSMSTIAFRLDV
ncbi:hypothetical protein LSAT2_014812, partial [Lamellibrachia satsuma]